MICSLATGRHRELLTESAPTLQAYARRHGWDIVLSCESLTTRPPSWAKVALITELMASYEMVFWIDADAIIVDLERDVLAEAGADADADIWFARHRQERDPDATVLNAGIILARSSPFARGLFDAMWHETEFIDHNWWENAALLHLLGYSLETPFAQVRESPWHDRVGELDLAWNSVPGYCESPQPAINHHARSDHDNFDRRLASMASDRRAVIERWPAEFGYPANAGQRTHEFVEVPHDTSAGGQPSLDDALRWISFRSSSRSIRRSASSSEGWPPADVSWGTSTNSCVRWPALAG